MLCCPPVDTLTTYIFRQTGNALFLYRINCLNVADAAFIPFLQIWSDQRAPTKAVLPRVSGDGGRTWRRKMRRRGRGRPCTGPNASGAKAAARPRCAECATSSWTPTRRPRSTTGGRRTRGGCADWRRPSAQVRAHRPLPSQHSSHLPPHE